MKRTSSEVDPPLEESSPKRPKAESSVSSLPIGNITPFDLLELVKLIVSNFDQSNGDDFGQLLSLSIVNKTLRGHTIKCITQRPGALVEAVEPYTVLSYIESINIILTRDTLPLVAELRLPNLRSIECAFLSRSGGVLPSSFIMAHATTVTRLVLRGTKQSTIEGKKTPFAVLYDYRAFTGLVAIEFDGNHLYEPLHGVMLDPSEHGLCHLTSLREISLVVEFGYYKQIIFGLITDMENIPQLETLCIKAELSSFAGHAGLMELTRLTNLTRLRLEVPSQDIFDKHPVLSLPKLRHLTLNDEISPQISCLSNLETLVLRKSKSIDAETIDAVIALTNLKKLAIEKCPSWEQISFAAAASLVLLVFLAPLERSGGTGKLINSHREMAAMIREKLPSLHCRLDPSFPGQWIPWTVLRGLPKPVDKLFPDL